MNLIVLHEDRNSLHGYGKYFVSQKRTEHEYDSLLRYAICTKPFCDIVFDYLPIYVIPTLIGLFGLFVLGIIIFIIKKRKIRIFSEDDNVK